jgi:uncharacterized membrane protein YadS
MVLKQLQEYGNWPSRFRSSVSELMPGILTCITLGLASSFISEHYGGPVMLYALLFGMAFNFLSEEGRCMPGVELTARTILRIGVALLGIRITVDQVSDLGILSAGLPRECWA